MCGHDEGDDDDHRHASQMVPDLNILAQLGALCVIIYVFERKMRNKSASIRPSIGESRECAVLNHHAGCTENDTRKLSPCFLHHNVVQNFYISSEFLDNEFQHRS